MINTSYAFTGITEFLRYLLYAALIAAVAGAAVAGAAVAGACCAIRAAWRRAGPARQHRRAEAALRAEVTRGLADIGQYLQKQSAAAASPNPETGNGGNDRPHDAEPRRQTGPGSKGETTR
jgi:hypothetical protein